MTRLGWLMGGAGLLMWILLAAELPARQDEKGEKFETKVGQRLPGPFRTYIVFSTPPPAPVTAAAEGQPSRNLSDKEINLLDAGRTQKLHCLVNRHGIHPTVAIFSRSMPVAAGEEKPTDPLSKLLLALEPTLAANRVDKLGAYCVFLTLESPLTDDVKEIAKDPRVTHLKPIAEYAKQLGLKAVSLSIEQSKAPQTELWNLDESVDVRVIVYTRLQVQGVWTGTKDKPLSDEDIAAIVAKAKELCPSAKK